MLDVRSGISRELMARDGTRYQTLVLASNPAVGNGGVNIGIHIIHHIAMMSRIEIQVVAWAPLSVIVFYHNGLVRGQIPVRVLVGV